MLSRHGDIGAAALAVEALRLLSFMSPDRVPVSVLGYAVATMVETGPDSACALAHAIAMPHGCDDAGVLSECVSFSCCCGIR